MLALYNSLLVSRWIGWRGDARLIGLLDVFVARALLAAGGV